MTMQTEEARDAVSVARALGNLEGQNDILIRMVEDQGRQIRENNRNLDAKIDRVRSDLDTKIDTAKSELNDKIDTAKSELNDKIDTAKSDLDAKIDKAKSDLDTKIDTAKSEIDAKIDAKMDKLLYWILGVGGFTTVTIIASAIAVIFAQR